MKRRYSVFPTACTTDVTAVLDNTSLDFGFFCDVNQNLKARRFLSGPLREQKFTSKDSKGHGLRFVIGGFRYVLRVSVFQSLLLLNFRVRLFSCFSSQDFLPSY